MFSPTQILLLVIIFLAIGFSLFAFIYYRGEKKEQLVYISLIVLFIVIAVIEAFMLYYSIAFISYFGTVGFILLVSVFLIVLLSLINLWIRTGFREKLKKLKI